MLLSEALVSVLAIYGVMMTRIILTLSEEEENDEEEGEVVTHSYR